MEAIFVKTKLHYKMFRDFKYELYKNDKSYVDTAAFVLEDVLYQKTPFTKSCLVKPVMIVDGDEVMAEAIFVYNQRLPYLQIAFFEARENAGDPVSLLLKEAKVLAADLKAEKIVIGLNAHISYGVGILTEGFTYKNSFDSLYNKPYYKEYFKSLPVQSLSTYREELSKAKLRLQAHSLDSDLRIEAANIKDLRTACRRMQALCEKTISKTFLYFSTEQDHFYYLMKDLAPFLKDENLLFAVDKNGNDRGFVFWHPDFNQMLKGGAKTSTLKIIFGYIFRRKSIDTLKLNAIGSLDVKATVALLSGLSKRLSAPYEYLETNFVWDNNIPSSLINKHILGDYHRKYEVYFLNANQNS